MNRFECVFRHLALPEELNWLQELDKSYCTSDIYRVKVTKLEIQLVPVTLPNEYYKTYGIDITEWPNWNFSEIALTGDKICGFMACQHETWNNRLVIQHLYIDSEFRRHGIGCEFVTRAESFAKSISARCLWVETQNTNLPAIKAYQAWGFSICGFDTSLYDDPEGTEQAVFLTKAISRDASS